MSTPATHTPPARVVIVDDTQDLRDLLRLALTRGGMEVVAEAGDGLAGIEAVRLERPDVVLLDLSMPVMDGLEALPSIRRLVPAAKIIVLSGFGAGQMSKRALATGADAYLQKGMSLHRILDYVRGVADDSSERPEPSVAQSPSPALTLAPSGVEVSVAPAQREVSAREALALAPYGVLEVADEPLFPIVHANPAAQRLLDDRARSGVPLGTIAPLLNSLVAYNRLDGDGAFVSDLGDNGVHATLRRTGGSLLIYLDSATRTS